MGELGEAGESRVMVGDEKWPFRGRVRVEFVRFEKG